MSKPNERLEAIFEAALALDSATQRAEYLGRACPDPEFRREVEALLAAHANPDSIFVDKTTRVEQAGLEHAGTVIGRYKLLEKLGEGGFGAVWLGEQKEPVRRKVALKVIKLGMDTRQVVARFEAERQALALMDHPNIAKVLDADSTVNGRPYFVMELVRGTPITRFCDENKLPARERLGLFIKVCHAVQHAHQKGIVHRDIKPSNVLVTLHDGVPVPKIIDFGIAKALQQELTDKTLHTMFQQFIGTPAYVSPEQAEMSGLDIDTRSDIYSLGVLLYELLAGVTPFDGTDLLASGLDAMRRTIREKEPPRPSTRVNTLPAAQRNTMASQRSTEPARLASLLRGDLDWIVMKCLEKDRDRRYETATGLARDVERHLANEPVSARPPSSVYRFQKMVRRNKLSFAAASAVLAALVAGLGVALAGMEGERLAKIRALAAEEGAVMERNRAVSQQERAETAEREARANLGLAQENASQARQLLYDADINLAHKAIQSKHLGLARRLLARHVPHGGIGKASLSEAFALGGEEVPLAASKATNDLRGWEWRYLWQQSQSTGTRLCKLERGIAGLSFAANGDWLAVTMLAGRKAELWSRTQGRRLQILTTNGCGAAQNWQAAFSPVAPVLAIGLAKGTVLVTNLVTGANWTLQTGALLGDAGMMADKLAFSPDGRYLAALGGHWWGSKENGALFVWETERFSLVSTNTSGRIGDGYGQGSLAWAPASKSIWIGATDSSIVETPALGGSSAFRGVATVKAGGLALAVSPLGDTLAISSPPDSALELWRICDRSPLADPRPLPGHAAFVSCLAYSPDGRWLASASCDQTIRLWNTTNWQSIELRGHTEEVHALAFTPDSRTLASGSRDGEVLLWPLESVASLREHQQLPTNVHSAVIAPGSQHLLAKLEDKSLAIIDARTLAMEPLPFPAADSQLLGVSGLGVIADGTNRLTFVEADDRGWRALGQIEGSINVLRNPHALRDRLFAFASGSNSVTCVSVDDVSRRFVLAAGPGVTNLIELGFHGPHLFGRDQDDGIHGWDLQERRLILQTAGIRTRIHFQRQPVLPDFIGFNESDPNERVVEFRDFAHPETVIRRFVVPYTIHHDFVFSPDDKLLAVSLQDTGSLLLFDLPSRSLKRSLQRHLMSVRAPRFSPDGKRLASCGVYADAIKLWDVETGQELMSLPANSTLNSFVQFSDDEKLILGQGWFLWRAPSWEEIRLADEAAAKRQAALANGPLRHEMQGLAALNSEMEQVEARKELYE